MSSKTIVVTGGGTGGHVFPALAICEEMKSRGFAPIYVGSASGMEAKLVPERGIPFETVKSGGIKNKGAVASVKALFKVGLSIISSMRFLSRAKPAAVIGVGGYVSVPVSIAAFLMRIPLFLQEQNSSVGIANRFLGKLARRIFLGFDEAKQWLPANKCVVTGNPLRKEFRIHSLTAPQWKPPTLLVFGGSQGAKAINDAVLKCVGELVARFPSLKIVHQTGEKDFPAVKDFYEKNFPGRAEVMPFIKDMLSMYERSSFVVSRSGALTVSELVQVGRPALLVPFPRKGQNDQTTNAYLLQKHGVAVVVEQGEAFENRFKTKLLDTFHVEQVDEMAKHFSALRGGDALVSIGDHVVNELKQ